MNIIELTEDNVEEYMEYLSEDVAENIGRTFYSGLVATDDLESPVGGIIWRYKNMLNDSDKESHIEWLQAEDQESFDGLFDKYDREVKQEGIVRSFFCLPAKTSQDLKKMLKERGFTVNLMEGDSITAKLSEIADISAFSKISISDAIMPLRSATQRGFSAAVSRTLVQGHYGTCEDLAYLPRLYFENDVSCYAEIDGQIVGMLLLHRTPSEQLEVVLMHVTGKESVKLLPQMIKQAVESAYESYEPDTRIIINRHDYASLALGERLFPRGFGIPVYEGKRAES
jgi:hypothetical protein